MYSFQILKLDYITDWHKLLTPAIHMLMQGNQLLFLVVFTLSSSSGTLMPILPLRTSFFTFAKLPPLAASRNDWREREMSTQLDI